MTDVRATRLQVLYDCYAVQSRRNLTDYHPGRWATVGEEIARDGFVTDARIDTFSMEWDAMQWLADGLLDGYVPEALYDLDTGDRINRSSRRFSSTVLRRNRRASWSRCTCSTAARASAT